MLRRVRSARTRAQHCQLPLPEGAATSAAETIAPRDVTGRSERFNDVFDSPAATHCSSRAAVRSIGVLRRSSFESSFSAFEPRFMNKIKADAVAQLQWDYFHRSIRGND